MQPSATLPVTSGSWLSSTGNSLLARCLNRRLHGRGLRAPAYRGVGLRMRSTRIATAGHSCPNGSKTSVRSRVWSRQTPVRSTLLMLLREVATPTAGMTRLCFQPLSRSVPRTVKSDTANRKQTEPSCFENACTSRRVRTHNLWPFPMANRQDSQERVSLVRDYPPYGWGMNTSGHPELRPFSSPHFFHNTVEVIHVEV